MTARLPAVASAAGWRLLAACASSYVNRAPPSPATSWRPPTGELHDFTLPEEPSLPVPAENPTPIDSGRVYNLPELIDIAESSNPDTRIPWARRKRASSPPPPRSRRLRRAHLRDDACVRLRPARFGEGGSGLEVATLPERRRTQRSGPDWGRAQEPASRSLASAIMPTARRRRAASDLAIAR